MSESLHPAPSYRSWRPYLLALGVLWVLPAVGFTIAARVLPDYNASGQCEGIGFGCVPTPADSVQFLAMGAFPVLLIAGLITAGAITWWQARRR